MYLWEILCRDTDELVQQIYETQKVNPDKGDWYLIIQQEKAKYGIDESVFEISKVSQYKFRKTVEKKIHLYTMKYLNSLANKHSKSTDLQLRILGEKLIWMTTDFLSRTYSYYFP